MCFLSLSGTNKFNNSSNWSLSKPVKCLKIFFEPLERCFSCWTLNPCVQGTGSDISTWIFLETLKFFSAFISVSEAESVSVSLAGDEIQRFAGGLRFFSGFHWNIVGTAVDFRRLLSVSGRKSSALKCAEQIFFLSGLKASLLILASQTCKMFT